MADDLETLTPDKIEEILSMKFEYYRNLPADDKPKFVERTTKFIELKEFIPREGIEMTAGIDDIRILISAAAIQVTFGLEHYTLDHFTRIFIYPREYYNSITKHWNKGEANVAGALVFSWKDFKAGYDDDTGKVSLGLHEMGHALMLNRIVGQDNDDFFVKYFDKWWGISQSEFVKLEQHEASLFRDYGGTNANEFFAVCTETFFKDAKEFNEQHPEIYRQTCLLFNQEPTRTMPVNSSVRETILSKEVLSVTPQNLLFRTKGRAWSDFVLYIVIALIVLGLSGLLTHTEWAGFVITPIVFLIIGAKIIGDYEEFFFYDNAFVIGYESLGHDTDKKIVFSPEQMVSVVFEQDGRNNPPSMDIWYVENSSLVEGKWKYVHLKAKD
ncbi:MAG TPA: zinc-dependent peptidase, partial [Bacteroidia bacterium]|nr:zinc-dependent peptidase [Bacteroidia bacterium]